MYIHIYIYIYIWTAVLGLRPPLLNSPGLHNKIPAHKIFARVWVAQEPICSQVVA